MLVAHASLRNGLIGAWCPSLDGGGTLLSDRSGVGSNASITSATWSALPGGEALSFNGSTAVATSTGVARMLNGATAATLSFWMYRAATNVSVAAGFSNSTSGAGGNRFSVILFTDGNLYVSAENGSLAYGVSASPVSTGIMHVAIRFSGSGATNSERLNVFVNGVQLSVSFPSGSMPSSLSQSLGSFTLGKDSSDRFGAGSLDDARVWSRALTAAEIRLLASRRGIGLVPQRQRRARLGGTQAYLNVGGTWKTATPWVNVGGVWKQATPSVNVGGTWK